MSPVVNALPNGLSAAALAEMLRSERAFSERATTQAERMAAERNEARWEAWKLRRKLAQAHEQLVREQEIIAGLSAEIEILRDHLAQHGINSELSLGDA